MNFPFEVIYEDNHIIAINKPAGMLVQGDRTGDIPLSEHVKEYIKQKYKKQHNVYLGVTHRIDRPVSGVLLFARTSKALTRLNKMFHDKTIQKTYWAVVKNRPPKMEDALIHYLIKDRVRNKSKAYPIERKGTKKSETKYKWLKSSDNYHLLEMKPLTGRHHQIRVQLSTIDCPIKGDIKYGFKRTNKDASIHLHARKIEFIHPVRKEPMVITAEPPKEVVWDALTSRIS
ncbi:MAG: RluA family pseudouridine synthase [Chitinophagales bacterium]